MLLTRFPRTPSGQTTTAWLGWETTARWLPSITFSPVNEPTRESKDRSDTVVVTNDRPPSDDEASTTRASTSAGSALRS